MIANFDPVYSFWRRSTRFVLIALWFGAIGSPSTGLSQQEVVRTPTQSEGDEKLSIDEAHPLHPVLEAAYKARKELRQVDDYECIFLKEEVVQTKRVKSKTAMKFRQDPFSVYLKFDPKDPNAGREVLYVQGQNGNNLLVREGGLASAIGKLDIAPKSTLAMADNKYPITDIGMKILLEKLIQQFEAEAKSEGIKTKQREENLPTGETCQVYDVIHQPNRQFKFHISRLYIDKAGLPIGVEQLGFPGKKDRNSPLVESYFYTKLRTNVKLTDTDFDPKNSKYAFK